MKHSGRWMKPFLSIFENILKSKGRSIQADEAPESRQTSGRTIAELENVMLAEKYILLLETLRSQAERNPAYADGSPRVISASPHVPVQLPGGSRK